MNDKSSDNGRSGAISPWLASLALKRGGKALPRFAFYYSELARLPRSWQRRLRRKLAVTLSSAALLLALAGPVAMAEPAAPAATITVVNGEVADLKNGRCSLIEAIINARAIGTGNQRTDCVKGNSSGPDTINLPTNGQFVLTTAHNYTYDETGLPVIQNGMVTINGNGSTIQRDSDSFSFRILAVAPSGNLTLNNTKISGGYLEHTYTGGAGIFNQGQLLLQNVTVSGNATYCWDHCPGGGVVNEGSAQVRDSLFQGNRVQSSDWGGDGGAIENRSGASLEIERSTFRENVSWGHRGMDGGAIFNRGALEIHASLFEMNQAKFGGAISNGGELVVEKTTFQNNGSLYGGAMMLAGTATIIDSTITNNNGAYYDGGGGGVHVVGTATIINTTISGNTANDWGYGGMGGGILNYGNLYLINSTVSRNDAYSGGGIANSCHSTGQITLINTIVSGNLGNSGAFDEIDNCSGAVFADRFNVIGHSGSPWTSGVMLGPTDIVPLNGLNSILSPLADNGGPTLTHALPAGSPALDRVPNADCTAAPISGIDQRGEPRNQNGSGGVSANECDAGAFERAGTGGGQMGFYLSSAATGNVGGVAFAPGDIIKFTPGQGWAMHFDASDVGITKNVTAIEVMDDGSILLALAAAQNVPGVGSVAPQDVIRFIPTTTGNNTAGTFQMKFDGSANQLSTTGEKIDALALHADGRLAISTSGAAAVLKPNGQTLKAQDEDAIGFNFDLLRWSELFDGTPITGLAAEDVNAMWINQATGEVYINILGTFNLGGITGNGQDIIKLTPSGAPGGYTPSLFWDGSAAGLSGQIDGLEMIP